MPVVFTTHPIGALIGGGRQRGLLLAVLATAEGEPRRPAANDVSAPAVVSANDPAEPPTLEDLTARKLARLVRRVGRGVQLSDAEDAVSQALLRVAERLHRGGSGSVAFTYWEARARVTKARRRLEVPVDPGRLDRLAGDQVAGDDLAELLGWAPREQRQQRLGGILCSGCRAILVRLEHVDRAERNTTTPCWCLACAPRRRPTRLLLDASGRLCGVAAVRETRRRGIRRVVQQLPKHQRVVVELVYFEGMTRDEAAKQLGIPSNTVKSRLAAGLASLRVMFERAGEL